MILLNVSLMQHHLDFLLVAVVIVHLIIIAPVLGSSNSDNDFQDWKFILYTGDKLWAGTDSEIYIELIGDQGNSPIIEIKPRKHQLEADAIDTFSLGKLADRPIGQLRQLAIGKQHSYSFFNDWQLIKAEVVDPLGKKYIFTCNCWLTSHKFKRLIQLSATEGGSMSASDSAEFHGFIGSRSTRVFPLTIGLLFLLLVLITFTYFGNEICKKWKENILFFNSTVRTGQNSFTSNRTETRSRSPRSSRRETDYDNGLLQGHIAMNAIIIEDKPPEYKELFPSAQSPNNETSLAAAAATTRGEALNATSDNTTINNVIVSHASAANNNNLTQHQQTTVLPTDGNGAAVVETSSQNKL